MKRFLTLILAFLIIATSLVSCSSGKPGNNNGAGDTNGTNGSIIELPKGIEATKLILANERLDSRLLKNNDNIFETGAQVMNDLASKAKLNLVNVTYSENNSAVSLSETSGPAAEHLSLTPVSMNMTFSATLLSTKNFADDGSYVEIDGNVYRWRNFTETSNSYDYFENLTNGIILSANVGAELIDSVKKNVRVVDKWVQADANHMYLLHVEDNMELLIERYVSEDIWQTRACRRYKNSDGINVYELYSEDNDGMYYMVYIPGKICEYAYQRNDGYNQNFLAENTKGFWEVVDINKGSTEYNVSCMVLKDDICYDAIYYTSPEVPYIPTIKIISSDRKTDILWYSMDPGMDGTQINLYLQGFNGVEYVESIGEMHKFESIDGEVVYTTDLNPATLVTKTGARIEAEDTFLDGKVKIERVVMEHYWYDIWNGGVQTFASSYVPYIKFRVDSKDPNEVVGIIKEFTAQIGLSCRRDMDYVASGITQAIQELSQFTKYHKWNESPITTEDTIAQGFKNRDAKYDAWKAEIALFDNAEKVDINNEEQMELNMHFAPITLGSGDKVTANGLSIAISDLAVSVSDTLLFVENEPYVVNFALLGLDGTDGMLTHLNIAELASTAYSGGDIFTVSSNTAFELPLLEEGSYTLVAYISTADGIRSSEYAPVAFTELTPYESKQGSLVVRTEKASDGTLLLTFAENLDIEVTVAMPEAGFHSYATMLDALSEQAYAYGFAEENAVVEKLGKDGNWTPLLGTEETLESGTYRLKYSIKNGTNVKNGTVFTNIS